MITKNIVFLLILILIIGGVSIYLINQQKIQSINSFEDCVQAGYPVMESYPRRCAIPDGRTFTEEFSQEEQEGLIPQSVELESSTSVSTSPVSPLFTPIPPKETGSSGGLCVDQCGDNMCQEIVCLGSGCPCAETATNCPKDCRKI